MWTNQIQKFRFFFQAFHRKIQNIFIFLNFLFFPSRVLVFYDLYFFLSRTYDFVAASSPRNQSNHIVVTSRAKHEQTVGEYPGERLTHAYNAQFVGMLCVRLSRVRQNINNTISVGVCGGRSQPRVSGPVLVVIWGDICGSSRRNINIYFIGKMISYDNRNGIPFCCTVLIKRSFNGFQTFNLYNL